MAMAGLGKWVVSMLIDTKQIESAWRKFDLKQTTFARETGKTVSKGIGAAALVRDQAVGTAMGARSVNNAISETYESFNTEMSDYGKAISSGAARLVGGTGAYNEVYKHSREIMGQHAFTMGLQGNPWSEKARDVEMNRLDRVLTRGYVAKQQAEFRFSTWQGPALGGIGRGLNMIDKILGLGQ